MLPATLFVIGMAFRWTDDRSWGAAPFAFVFGMIGGVFYSHRLRGLGLAALANLTAAIACAIATVDERYRLVCLVAAGGSLGFAATRMCLFLGSVLRASLGSMLLLPLCVGAVLLGKMLSDPPIKFWSPPSYSFEWLTAASGSLALFSVMFFHRQMFELFCELVLFVLYRVRPVGSGLATMPQRGPIIVIANHACWFDPHILGKMLPRPITPMMGSDFYDIPVIHFLMKHVIRAIRVAERVKKPEVPDEVRDAIAALDRGECLVIFPEGSLRRSDDKPLKRFGRGVWQILAARPDTPVYCCWIEGGWGSYFSYMNGPPTKNKRMDVRRPMAIAIPEPIKMDATTLAHHMTTRIFLMNRVLDARKWLALPELPPFDMPKADDDQA